MEKAELLELLKEVRKERGILRKIELAIGMPQNSLSREITDGTLPKKWVEPIATYLTAPKPKTIELPADWLNVEKLLVLKVDGTLEEVQGSPNAGAFDITPIWEELVRLKSQIQTTKAEKIPKERDTVMGRSVWEKEQSKKIEQLTYQILNKIPT
jgi:hypothetical protein